MEEEAEDEAFEKGEGGGVGGQRGSRNERRKHLTSVFLLTSFPSSSSTPSSSSLSPDRLRKHWEGKDGETTRTPSGGKNLFLAFTSTPSFTQTKGTEAGSEGK